MYEKGLDAGRKVTCKAIMQESAKGVKRRLEERHGFKHREFCTNPLSL